MGPILSTRQVSFEFLNFDTKKFLHYGKFDTGIPGYSDSSVTGAREPLFLYKLRYNSRKKGVEGAPLYNRQRVIKEACFEDHYNQSSRWRV